MGTYELGQTKEIDETSWAQSQYIRSKNSEKLRKNEIFQEILGMFRECFGSVSIVFSCVLRSVFEANVLRLEPLRGD